MARLARGDAAGSVDLATRTVTRDPLDESARVVLVRFLRAAGRVEEARQQVRNAATLIRRELGVEPSSALTAAAGVPGSGDAGARHEDDASAEHHTSSHRGAERAVVPAPVDEGEIPCTGVRRDVWRRRGLRSRSRSSS